MPSAHVCANLPPRDPAALAEKTKGAGDYLQEDSANLKGGKAVGTNEEGSLSQASGPSARGASEGGVRESDLDDGYRARPAGRWVQDSLPDFNWIS
jgi:hypothetical protein